MAEEERRRINGTRIAMIFQDPLSHLNPVYSVGLQIAEMMTTHGIVEVRGAGADAGVCCARRHPRRRRPRSKNTRTSSPAVSGSD